MPVTTSSTLSTQYQNFFSKKLLSEIIQNTVMDQWAFKAPVPKNAGAKAMSSFRFGPPSIATIASNGAMSEATGLPTTPGTPANFRALVLSKLDKTLAQYSEVVGLTDITLATQLFNSLKQASKTVSNDMALWVDSLIRNTLIGSDYATSGGSIGAAAEGGGTFDNSDACNTAGNAGGINVYGAPGTLTTQTFAGLNTDTAAANTTATSAGLLDLATRLQLNRAPMINGKYVYVCDPRVARDLMRDADWLNASNYGNKGEPYYKGEVGEIYGTKVVMQTNSFISRRVSADTDQFVYSTAGTSGLAAGSRIYAGFMFGNEAYSIPQLEGDNAMAPQVIINDKPDKADPLNQLITVGVKVYFGVLRLAAGNTASTGNPVWYLVHRVKSASNA
jgi:N4-gp56 family major capsid protein